MTSMHHHHHQQQYQHHQHYCTKNSTLTGGDGGRCASDFVRRGGLGGSGLSQSSLEAFAGTVARLLVRVVVVLDAFTELVAGALARA